MNCLINQVESHTRRTHIFNTPAHRQGIHYNIRMTKSAPEIREDIDHSQKTEQGPLYRVIIHNDNLTPMDFVIYVLRQIFYLSGVRAVQVMYSAHYHGSAYVDTLPKVEAQKRVHQAHFTARMQAYPLKFTLERE